MTATGDDEDSVDRDERRDADRDERRDADRDERRDADRDERRDADRYGHCLTAAEAGAERAMASFRTSLTVERKDGEMDAVTEIDRDAQRIVTSAIGEHYPDEPVVGEEEDAPKSVPAEGAAWVVDPIDGTNNYVCGSRTWVTSVASVIDGEPVAAATVSPATGDTYTADRDSAYLNGTAVTTSTESDPSSFLVNPIFGLAPTHRRELAAVTETILSEFGDLRRIGCAQAALAGVATGEIHAAVSTVELNDWDTVAGVHIVRQAGGTVTDAAGDRWKPGATGLIASNGEAHETLVEAVEPVSES
jgi:myo-inositol-1(or 4)-monophosphatase